MGAAAGWGIAGVLGAVAGGAGAAGGGSGARGGGGDEPGPSASLPSFADELDRVEAGAGTEAWAAVPAAGVPVRPAPGETSARLAPHPGHTAVPMAL